MGVGVDAFHGVRHAQFLENVAALARAGGYWGAFSMTAEMPEAQLFLQALEHAEADGRRPSIVIGSIASALEGRTATFTATRAGPEARRCRSTR